ncbi:DUF2934 domain-containing protein [Halomonas sp. McH1-25]|uniref:DUF2934 domain-containing protein n=1 Tax=unclassified Halomonas TaxID=2609666 RepID=UPI001EF6D8CF|nr:MULTISPECIES: DUF2934 domain-containing protein [unclassified Halomonas]MCG7600539.1 DUF2934 domain-containing protein [Halomonas sp. McH1-25]MCP1342006.1 DUF2934 domain-containing protein [Halomonas sp. FL8]MCP1362801.1 DUF2934 domain-containing protein [Halomonas sp. BBD45]MCP1366235.1 DUF2934 domain-containing protein [Halomonas sp. BBD48]
MADDELRVRQLAYRIWESEGRPEGQEQRHWEMARKIVAAERESGRDAQPDIEIEADEKDPDLPVRDDELGVEQDDMGLGSSGTRPPATDPEEDALADETPDRNLGRDKEGVPVAQSDASSATTPLPEESATVKRTRQPRRSEDTVTTPNATDTSSPGRSSTTRSRAGAAKTEAKAAKSSTATKTKAGSKATADKSAKSRATAAGKSDKTDKKTKASDTPRKPRK